MYDFIIFYLKVCKIINIKCYFGFIDLILDFMFNINMWLICLYLMNFIIFKVKYSVLNECFLKRELFVFLIKIYELEMFCKRYNLI